MSLDNSLRVGPPAESEWLLLAIHAEAAARGLRTRLGPPLVARRCPRRRRQPDLRAAFDMIDDSRVELLSAADDGLHAPSDHPSFFESSWWSFYVPERNLGAWIYHWVRPNQSTQGGGCWLYDDTTWSHLDVPYYACYEHAASGVDTEVLEPLRRYRISFRDRDLIAFDFDVTATMPPWIVADGHFDQMMHVTGELELHGDTIRVDSIAMRDRSWSPRPERWKDGHVGYCSAGTRDVAFLVNSASGMRGETSDRVPRASSCATDGAPRSSTAPACSSATPSTAICSASSWTPTTPPVGTSMPWARRAAEWRCRSPESTGSAGRRWCTGTSTASTRGATTRTPGRSTAGLHSAGASARRHLDDRHRRRRRPHRHGHPRPPTGERGRLTDTMVEIADAFTALGDDRDVRVAIFTAAGDRAFMAGVDLRSLDSDRRHRRSAARERDRSRPASPVTPCGRSPTARCR